MEPHDASMIESRPTVSGPEHEMEVAPDGVVRRVDPSYIKTEAIGWRVFGGIVLAGGGIATVVCAVAGVAGWVLALIGGGTIVVLALIAWAMKRLPRLNYERLSYVLTPDGLEIGRGMWFRSITSVPRSRVQHIDVVQGPILRKYGLATLVIHTAGTQQASVTLEGLAHPVALRIRDFLVQPDSETSGVEGNGDGV